MSGWGEASVIAHLREHHFNGPAWAVICQVAHGTGYKANRHLDAMAMSLWPSRGIEMHGIEVKVTRADFMRELKDPKKAEELAVFCRYFWIAAPVDVVPLEKMPSGWGLLEVSAGKKPVVVKKPAEKREVGPPTWDFLAAILRRAAEALEADRARSVPASKVEEIVRGRCELHEKRDIESRIAEVQSVERLKHLDRENELAGLKNRVQMFQARSGLKLDDEQGAYGSYRLADAVAAARAYGLAETLARHRSNSEGLREIHRLLGDALDTLDAVGAKATEIAPPDPLRNGWGG